MKQHPITQTIEVELTSNNATMMAATARMQNEEEENDDSSMAYQYGTSERPLSNAHLTHIDFVVRRADKVIDADLFSLTLAESSKPFDARKTSVKVNSTVTDDESGLNDHKHEREDQWVREHVDVLQDPGATPSVCHVRLAKRLGLVSKNRQLNISLSGAFQGPAQRAAQYVVMVATVSGYREECWDEVNQEWTQLVGFAESIQKTQRIPEKKILNPCGT